MIFSFAEASVLEPQGGIMHSQVFVPDASTSVSADQIKELSARGKKYQTL